MFIFILIIILLVCTYNFIYNLMSKNKINDDEITFRSSFTRGGSIIIPQKLIFTHKSIKLITNDGYSTLWTTTTTQTIPYNKIVGIEVKNFIVGCNITIIGNGIQNIFAKGFTGDDAGKIEEMIKIIIEDK